ncbi:hypothetical protein [Nocardia transvalensis]|uniref:hypothetical protein n=1 Tax=Nocardia transvalensis TaxID=37333 RepID=UPI001895DA45|nr:hypothetical protein [Nocardia transvalensis]MBF6330413.1 hypothetical protein [Nocardia transvalensis]
MANALRWDEQLPNDSSWNVISPSTSNRILLAVDFPAAGRREAGFGDLAGKMGSAWGGYTFLQTTPPTVNLTDRPTGDFYTEHWLQGTDWSQCEVVAVFGYCVGSVYAAELAKRLVEWQSAEPKVVLFDPQLTDHQLLVMEMTKMVTMAGPVFSDDEGRQARQKAKEIIEKHENDVTAAAIDIVALYHEMISLAFQRIGLADARRDEVVRLFESYMSWLAAAGQVDPSEVWGRSTAITSSDWVGMESRGETTVLNASKVVGATFPLDVSHADLMRSDEAVALLMDHAGIPTS